MSGLIVLAILVGLAWCAVGSDVAHWWRETCQHGIAHDMPCVACQEKGWP